MSKPVNQELWNAVVELTNRFSNVASLNFKLGAVLGCIGSTIGATIGLIAEPKIEAWFKKRKTMKKEKKGS